MLLLVVLVVALASERAVPAVASEAQRTPRNGVVATLVRAESARINATVHPTGSSEQVEMAAAIQGARASGVVTTHPGGQSFSTYWVAEEGAGYVWGPGGWQRFPLVPGYAIPLVRWPLVASAASMTAIGTVQRDGRTLEQLRTDASGFYDLLYPGYAVNLPADAGQLDLFVDETGVPIDGTARVELPNMVDPSQARTLDIEFSFTAWGESVVVEPASTPPRNPPSYDQPQVAAPTPVERCRRLVMMERPDEVTDAQRRDLHLVYTAALTRLTVYLFVDDAHDAICSAEDLAGYMVYDASLGTHFETRPEFPVVRGLEHYESTADGSLTIMTGSVGALVARVEVLLSDGTRNPAEIHEGRYIAAWESVGGQSIEAVVAFDAAGHEVGRR